LILKGGAQASPFLYGITKEKNRCLGRCWSVKKTKGREKFLLDPVLTSTSPQPMFQAKKN
jgi:hypothetical protein